MAWISEGELVIKDKVYHITNPDMLDENTHLQNLNGN